MLYQRFSLSHEKNEIQRRIFEPRRKEITGG
jgi:hypothetical protein